MSPLKLQMLLHFHAIVGRYPDERTRMSSAYSHAVREMLREGLIERPSNAEREAHPGWAYRTTDKGHVYVAAILDAVNAVPLPIRKPVAPPPKPEWMIPARGGEIKFGDKVVGHHGRVSFGTPAEALKSLRETTVTGRNIHETERSVDPLQALYDIILFG